MNINCNEETLLKILRCAPSRLVYICSNYCKVDIDFSELEYDVLKYKSPKQVKTRLGREYRKLIVIGDVTVKDFMAVIGDDTVCTYVCCTISNQAAYRKTRMEDDAKLVKTDIAASKEAYAAFAAATPLLTLVMYEGVVKVEQ